MKVFITGATGFVGSHVAQALSARGDEVVALARRLDAHDALAGFGVRPVAGSLEDPASLRAGLEGVDVVYHVAGATSAAGEKEFFAVNEGGTRSLLEAAAVACPSARFVYISSQAALGPSPRNTPLDEDTPCHPLTAYGRSKRAGEVAVQNSSLPWTIVRPPAVYGPRDREFLQLFKVVRRGIAPVFGDGSQQLSMVFVTDLATAIVLAGTTARAAGRVYHTAHKSIVFSRDVALEAGRAIGRKPVILPLPALLATPLVTMVGYLARLAGQRTVINADKMAEFLARAWLMSSGRAREELGWTAATDLRAGMESTARWYTENRWL